LKFQSKRDYIKHIYWLTGAEEAQLRIEMDGRKIKMRSAKGVVCTPLDEINKISSVAPKVWNDTCARQGSWYRASDKEGLYLVVSSFELNGYEDRKAAVITRSEFDPPRLAKTQEKKDMIQDPEFREQVPSQWWRLGKREKEIYIRWAKRLGSEIKDFDVLHMSHTANHANFVKPSFFIREKQNIIPYSIDRSAHLCSCCLELFQVLGAPYPKKLVAPCPGATLFARLKPDQYLLVENA